MSELEESSVIFGNKEACYALNGKQFKNEQAVILAEIYRYNSDWRVAIIGRGFDGELSALLSYFGGEEASPEPEPSQISLKKSEEIKKIVLEKAPHLADLTKKAIVSLEKKNILDVKANVVLVLDVSGSMEGQYKKGRVQRILDKVIPLALLFDDNGSLESWGFATKYKQLTNATLDNVKDYIIKTDGGWKKWKIGWTNEEPAVMKELYLRHKDSKLPVYIIFISYGGVTQNRKIKEIVKTAAYAPMVENNKRKRNDINQWHTTVT